MLVGVGIGHPVDPNDTAEFSALAASAGALGVGLVTSLARPDGNVTGVSQFASALVSKRLELIRELVPTVVSLTVLINPSNPNAESVLNEAKAAARAFGPDARARSPVVHRLR